MGWAHGPSSAGTTATARRPDIVSRRRGSGRPRESRELLCIPATFGSSGGGGGIRALDAHDRVADALAPRGGWQREPLRFPSQRALAIGESAVSLGVQAEHGIDLCAVLARGGRVIEPEDRLVRCARVSHEVELERHATDRHLGLLLRSVAPPGASRLDPKVDGSDLRDQRDGSADAVVCSAALDFLPQPAPVPAVQVRIEHQRPELIAGHPVP